MKSDQNQPHDSTEDWLRQTLGNHNPEAPADAWHRLAPHLPQRKRRRPFVFWLSGAAAVITFFWFLKNAETQVGPLDSVEKMPPVSLVLPACSSQGFKKNKAVTVSKNPTSATAGLPIPENLVLRKCSPPVETNLFKNKPISTTKSAEFSEKNSLKSTLILSENSTISMDGESNFSEKQTALTPEFSQKFALPQTQNSLETIRDKTLVPLVLAEKPLREVQFSVAPILPKKARAPRFWLGLETAPAVFLKKLTAENTAGLVFPETPLHPGRGWQAGISFAFEPRKNWRIATGIQHFGQTHVATHSATLRLTDGVLLNPQGTGLKEYQFQYAIVSGGEKSDLTLRLQQQNIGSTMPMDEPFTLDMKTIHRSTAWRVPLSVERRFGAGKWWGFVRSGVVLDFSETSTVQVTHYTEMCQDLCFQSGHVPAIQASKMNKTAVGWVAGAGIERQISRRAALRFEPFAVVQKGSLQCGLSIGLLFSN